MPLNDTTEEYEYDDFDDLQEEQSPPSPMVDILKYFGGLVSLVSLINDFNGGGGLVGEEQSKHEKHVRDVQESNPEEKKEDKVQATGKQFYESQDRFDFPQKKFKKPSSTKINTGNQQQYQTLENYPPYNPLTANAAETYNGDDKKTSYDVYNTGQQYESLNNDGGNSWDEVHPVYQPWMSKPQENNDDGLPSSNSYQWQQDDLKLGSDGTYDLKQPWTGNPVYNQQDFDDHHHHHHHPHEHEDVDEVRVSKKPYSYYFLGRKLWYIPLLFSVYFIIYIGALVLKSVARHKIQFPEKVWDLHDSTFGHSQHRKHRKLDDMTEKFEKAVEKFKNIFM